MRREDGESHSKFSRGIVAVDCVSALARSVSAKVAIKVWKTNLLSRVI